MQAYIYLFAYYYSQFIFQVHVWEIWDFEKTMKILNFRYFKICGQGIMTFVIMTLILQLLNSISYIYLLEKSSKGKAYL